MTFPTSHKTVFVLDHGATFSSSCRQSVEFDIFVKTRQPGIIPLAPVAKSMWTCSVEAAVEYCRIVWDIFPVGKLIRFLVVDSTTRFLNSWSQDEQSLTYLMPGFAQVGPPRSSKESNILMGLKTAIEALSQCSEIQHDIRTSMTEKSGRLLNRGRVICVSSYKSDNYIKNLEDCFHEALEHHNQLAASSESLIPVHHCELILIHTHGVTEESVITHNPKHDLSPILSCEIHAVKSGRHVAAKLCYLVLSHYDLASTTVTGIPMKEEQNASSSANYDVEIFHPSTAHVELLKTGFLSSEGVHVTLAKEGQSYETMTLKWCTPRSSSVELHFCTGAFRVSPVDVNSRPSSCLTNFLLSGRAVMLEMPRKSGSKVLSHMLASHGGELFIHTLGTARSTLEDPPSISEGCGGRVTDYRINDFGEFMKQNKLVPWKPGIVETSSAPISKAQERLERLTQYWPMVISNTTIFNMASQMGPLLSLVTKETLTTDEVNQCRKVVFELVSMDSKGTSLPVPSGGTRGKGPKREEQYRIMWNELESFVRVHCTTVEHSQVLDCVLECRKPSGDSATPSEGSSSVKTMATNGYPKKELKTLVKEEKMDTTDFFHHQENKYEPMEVDKFEPKDSFSETKFQSLKKGHSSADGPSSSQTAISSGGGGTGGSALSLLTIWTNRLNTHQAKHHTDFVGRVNSVNGKAKLYAFLTTDASNEDSR